MKIVLPYLPALALCLFPFAGAPAQSAQWDNIFGYLQTFDPLDVVIEADLKALKEDRQGEEWQSAVFRIMQGDSVAYEQQVQIAARGNMRRKTCDFPPVKIRFYQDAPADDSLADINQLKLVVSCRDRKEDDQLVLMENLAYRLYNLITEESFRVKSATIVFKTPDREKAYQESMAFFIESEKEMATRLGGRPLKPRIISPKIMDSLAFTRMSVFQYMIGNTDWGVYTRHNVKVVGFQTGRRPLVVPYDFDYSGLVDADYAIPSPDIPIQGVRERYYLGMCYSAQLHEQVFAEFLSRKHEMLNVCQRFSGLSYAGRQDARAYINSFFSILENPKKATKEIVEHCNYRLKKN
ncbi:MAG: hypothetical protein IPH12_02080 [Saprospirales bacterium]|nr:hypothetical protein [Saprospirales bacterium]MBK8921561.1 hypothetical protein [Saprospirales bacterium]